MSVTLNLRDRWAYLSFPDERGNFIRKIKCAVRKADPTNVVKKKDVMSWIVVRRLYSSGGRRRGII